MDAIAQRVFERLKQRNGLASCQAAAGFTKEPIEGLAVVTDTLIDLATDEQEARTKLLDGVIPRLCDCIDQLDSEVRELRSRVHQLEEQAKKRR